MSHFKHIADRHGWLLASDARSDHHIVDIELVSVAKNVARSTAVQMVESALAGAVSASAVEAARVDTPYHRGAQYFIDWNKPQWFHPAWLWRSMTSIGLFSTGHSVAVPARTIRVEELEGPAARDAEVFEQRARDVLAGSVVAGQVNWDHHAQHLRRALGPAPTPHVARAPLPTARDVAIAVSLIVGLSIAFGSGVFIAGDFLSWRLSLLIASLPTSVLFLSPLTDSVRRDRWRKGIVGRLAISLGAMAFGFEWMSNPPPNGGSQLRYIVVMAATLGICWGAVHLQAIPWLWGGLGRILTIAAPSVFIVSWMPYLLWSAYADGFGLPDGALATTGLMKMFIIAKPLGILLLILAIATGVTGWTYYFRLGSGGVALSASMMLLVVVVYGITVLQTSLTEVDSARKDAQRAAIHNTKPEWYLGLELNRVCVTPITEAPAVQNGPLPTSHPVLILPSSDDNLWIWDPANADRRHTVRVQSADVTTTTARDGQRTCAGA
ncbi:hypothetical protein HJ588_15980 [Flexivirga sp. ID2601S]|uniref:Uncharacterized protein n=1 Tax=Flexivirga aerilata TaxID=1656889 RepID=A0A849AL30_9MICO|nr:hypothetical protein [Flexivirga aerilata]NNG40763.1 hypothetical protein [Flexivirga aerilata]